MDLTSGLRIGKYELGELLGRGGFGVVFAARDSELDRIVALKFLSPEHTTNPEVLQRFLREARAAATIAHPGIVTVFECGQVAHTGTAADGTAFIAMELLAGESLEARIAARERMPADEAMEIARQIASALEAAHRAGIIHRDLKPDNVFLVEDPAVPRGERVKILDFGIAKLQTAVTGTQTQSMQIFGTPRYMSPEQCKSSTQIDRRSDIYTLGCILFEMVCGKPPFDGLPGEVLARHILGNTPRASSIADVPEVLDDLIAQLLAKEPADRPQSMADVKRALDAALGIAERSISPGPRRPPILGPTTLSAASGASIAVQRRRSTLALAGGLLAGATVVTLGLWLALHGRETIATPDRAPAGAPDPVRDPARASDPVPVPDPAPVRAPVPAPDPDRARGSAAAPASPPVSVHDAPSPRPPATASDPAPPQVAEHHAHAPPPPAAPVPSVLSKLPPQDMPSVRACYQRTLDKDPYARDKLFVSFRVDLTGRTSLVNVVSNYDALDTCVTAAVHGWTFPPNAPFDVTTTIPLEPPPPPAHDSPHPIGDGTVDPFEKK